MAVTKVKKTITIDEELDKEISEFIKKHGMSRSSFFSIAGRSYMDSNKILGYMDKVSELSEKIVSGDVKVDDESVRKDAILLNAILSR